MTELAEFAPLKTILRAGLRLPIDTTEGEYEALGFALGEFHRALQFACGDYILDGEKIFGERAYQLQESLGLSEEQRRQYVRVSERIPIERRRKELSWAHHREVAALEPAEQDRWLALAVENSWNKAELVAVMRPTKELAEPKGTTCPHCGNWIAL